MGFFSFFKKDNSKEKEEVLDKGLAKTKESVFGKISRAIVGKSKVDDEVLDNLEEILITSDVGVETTLRIIERIEERVARDKYVGTDELHTILKEEVVALLAENNLDDLADIDYDSSENPYVILVVGVNGVGKTTTIGKLAAQFTRAGKKVYLGAADTFRAAAVEQLDIWGERVGCPVVKQKMGADPASVAYDTLASAKANKADVVIIDTAGRLHNKINLMEELKKIGKVVSREWPEAEYHKFIVVDGTTGQNSINQVQLFNEAVELTDIVITKLDGTSKGGFVVGLANDYDIAVRYIGVGESAEDLLDFDAKEFVEAIFE